MNQFLLLATEAEGIAPSHIAAKLAVPLGIVIFVGAVYALLWSNYGAKKGALIYSTAFFAFTTMLGVFWWFGAPGTPVATGPQNFPGQASDAYQGKWYGFEPGSERAKFFPATNSFDNFQTVPEYATGKDVDPTEVEDNPRYGFINGDVAQAAAVMLNQYLPTDEQGSIILGAQRRKDLQESAGAPEDGEIRATPFLSTETIETRVTNDNGVRVAASRIRTIATFNDQETGTKTRDVEVETGEWFAFKDPGAIWFPSAVWTFVSLILFLGSMFLLDLMEGREKRAREVVVAQPEDVKVPIHQ